MRTHIPYRRWCAQCVEGNRKSVGQTRQEDDITEHDVAQVIALDHMKLNSKDIGEEEKREKKERGNNYNKNDEEKKILCPRRLIGKRSKMGQCQRGAEEGNGRICCPGCRSRD